MAGEQTVSAQGVDTQWLITTFQSVLHLCLTLLVSVEIMMLVMKLHILAFAMLGILESCLVVYMKLLKCLL